MDRTYTDGLLVQKFTVNRLREFFFFNGVVLKLDCGDGCTVT
jgi:hypothetical protein